jgi:hypothetical protein
MLDQEGILEELRVTTTTGSETILAHAAVDAFKASLRGILLRPGDDGYDATRKVYNAMIDKRPALIARCGGRRRDRVRRLRPRP